MDRPVQRIAVEPVLERGRRPARQDRRAHEPLRPRDRPATGVEASGHAIVVVRAEHVMLHIFLAGPDDFHRPLDLFRDAHGLGDVVVFEAPTEPAAQQMVVYHDLVERQAGDLGGRRLRAPQDLRAGPHLAAVRPHVHRAVDRLHRHMGEERRLVHRLELRRRACQRGRGVALLARHYARRFGRCRELADDVLGADCRVRPVVPADGEGGEPLLRRPHVVRHYGDQLL